VKEATTILIGHPVSKLCVCSCSCSWTEIAHILSFRVWMNIRRTRAAAQTFSIFCDRHDRQYDMTTVATAPFWAGQCRSGHPHQMEWWRWRGVWSSRSLLDRPLHYIPLAKEKHTVPSHLPYWLAIRKHRFLALFASLPSIFIRVIKQDYMNEYLSQSESDSNNL
jgi:hypothetical protein